MSLTNTNAVGTLPGAGTLVAGTLTFDNSYVTGGMPVTPTILGYPTVGSSVVWMLAAAVRGVAGTVCYSVRYDATAKTLMAFNTTAGAQTANATDCSALIVDYIALIR